MSPAGNMFLFLTEASINNDSGLDLCPGAKKLAIDGLLLHEDLRIINSLPIKEDASPVALAILIASIKSSGRPLKVLSNFIPLKRLPVNFFC